MGPSGVGLEDARRQLRAVWGYQEFRHHQRRAILAALRGRDCLAVLPTGGGKSLCYQVPGLLLPGLTVVVSPLISLMQDQVAALRSRGVSAAYLSSTQRPEVQRAVWSAVCTGRVKILYVAPERMPAFVARVGPASLSLVAVDEAHCISEWGHDFRPHYRALGAHLRALERPPVMALTATATPETRGDIAQVLGLRRPVTVVQPFDRPNLRFAVRRCRTQRERLEALHRLLRDSLREGTSIVYAPTRNRTDGLAAVLRRWGIPAAPYHAGLPGGARRALLARFLDGRLRVVVATSAFGMGIDRPDVRLVVHVGVPTRPEAYFQQAGRAGRDGAPAHCVLLWVPEDLTLAARLACRSRGASRGPPAAASHEADRRALRTMRRYITGRACRRRVLLEYLGDRPGQCAGCDRCGVRVGAVSGEEDPCSTDSSG
jgi:ATP-dependent DNA helicase RecQ